jgi:long-chain acyl-CoA synthetase
LARDCLYAEVFAGFGDRRMLPADWLTATTFSAMLRDCMVETSPGRRSYILSGEQLHAMAETFGDECAYRLVGPGTGPGEAHTFAEWDGAASRLARWLAGQGVLPDDRVIIHLSTSSLLEWMTAYAAIHRAGAVAVPLSPQLTRPELERTQSHCEAKAAFVGEPIIVRYGDAWPEIVVAVPGAGPSAGEGGGGPAGSVSAAAERPVSWAEAVAGTDTAYFQVAREGRDMADILYTSGTTGSPKAVVVRHDNSSGIPFARPQWTGNKWLHASPPWTFAGITFIYTPLKLGMQGLYMPRFDATAWLEVVESERPTAAFLVPAMAALLLEHPRFDSADLSSLQLCTVGSAPLDPRVLERLQAKLPKALVSNNYGMTEAGSVYCLMPPGEAVRRPGSVGKVLPPAEIACVDDAGEPVPAGEIGHVRLKISGRPREYFRDPEATAGMWVDGWLLTGDLGKLDEDGYLYIVGRTKDVIIRGGNNIYPIDVEYAICSHPAVQEAAVLGVEHPVLGEDVMAFVVLRQGAGATADELRAHTLASLAEYKVPRRWRFVEELPRNSTGKVVKAELRSLLADDEEGVPS